MSEKPTYEELERRIRELELATSEYERLDKEQQKTEQRYKNLFDHMLHEVHVWELVRDDYGNIKTWKLIDANPVALKAWNKGLSEVVGKTTDEMFPGLGATEQFMPIVEKIFAENAPHIWEQYFPNTGQFLHMISAPFGEYFISTGLDITERRQAEATLRQKHEMLERTEAIANVGSWEWEIETDTVIWSEELYRIFQFDPDGEAPSWAEHPKLFHPEDFENIRQAAETAMTDGKPYELELRAFRKDGETRICKAKGFPIIRKDGNVVRLYGLLQDITDQKRTENELQKSNERLLELTNQVPVVVYQFYSRPNGKMGLYYVSDKAEEIFGLKGDLDEFFEHFTELILPEYRKDFLQSIQKVTEEVRPWHFEGALQKPTGERIWFAGHSTPSIRDTEVVFNGILLDITDQKEHEILLEKKNTDLKLAQRIASIGFWALDPEVGVPEWSEEVYRIYERDPSLGPYPLHEYKHIYKGQWFQKFSTAIQGAIADGIPYDIELKLEFPTGKEKWVHAICEPEPEIGPKGHKVRGTMQDITNKRQAERAREASEARYARLAANIPGVVFQNLQHSDDPTDDEFPYISPGIRDLFGLTPEEVMRDSRTIWALIHPDDTAALTDSIQHAVETGAYWNYDFRVTTTDGETKWLRGMASHERQPDGSIFWDGLLLDISAPKRIEEALRENEEKYRLLVNNANDAIFIAQEGKIKFPNPKTKDITGYSTGELANMSFTDIVHPEDRDLVLRRHLQRLKGEDPPSHYSFRIINKAVDEVLVEINAAAISWEGRPATINIIRDITEQKKIEDRLRHSQKMESIGNLAGGIAHDFNNILSSVIGFTELALDEASKGTTLEDSLQEVYSAGKRAKDLVKQILAFARQSEEKIGPVQPSVIAREVLKFIRSTIPTTIEIRQEVESSAMIMGNATQVHQVLMNLCTNAAYAMEDSGGVLSLSIKEVFLVKKELLVGMKPGEYAEIKISDSGVGIAPEIIDSIFEPYFTTKDPGEGTGMGLALVQGVVESHGGKIAVNSQLGKGATFTVHLPITKKRSAQDAYVAEKLPAGTERILFIDDEAPIARMGGQILEQIGYSVTTRTSSVEALELFQAKSTDFDLVITDMTMPNMTGDKLAVELMKIRPDIPVILCTGYSKKISDEIVSEIGIKAFAYKPVVKADLAKTVRKVLDEAKGSVQVQ